MAELQSPDVKRPKPNGRQYSGSPIVSPDSHGFDISAAWYNHPGPFSGHRMGPETGRAAHDSSTDSFVPDKDRVRPRCSCCDPIPEQSEQSEQSGSKMEINKCLNSAEILNTRTDEFPAHHHRHQSSISADKGIETLRRLSQTLGQKSTIIEVESNTLSQESIPLKEVHSDEDASSPSAEEPLSRHKVNQGEWENFDRVQKFRSELWIKKENFSSHSVSQTPENEVEEEPSVETTTPENVGNTTQRSASEVRKEENFYGKYI